MRVKFSKAFEKASKRLPNKVFTNLQKALQEVKQAQSIDDISNCIKMVGFQYAYRIRVGSHRAFFIFHVEIIDDVVRFEYLIPRGQAYDKKNMDNLRGKDI